MTDYDLRLVETTGSATFQVLASAGRHGEAWNPPKIIERETVERLAEDAERFVERGAREEDLARLGRELFGCLIEGPAWEIYLRAREAVAGNPQDFLRVRIWLSEGSRLQQVPWELLHDGRSFLAKDTRAAVVRYREQKEGVPEFRTTPPLHVLVTTANPPDQDLLDLEAEVRTIRLAYAKAGKQVKVAVARDVSLARLEALWRHAATHRKPIHVWHHCGHGSVDQVNKEFELCLIEAGRTQWVGVSTLQNVVGYCPGLRLAVLNVCQGSAPAGLVPSLAGMAVPVVVGFLHEVEDASALKFAAVLHRALLELPVEQAVSIARRSLAISDYSLAWSLPCLFSRRRDSELLLARPRPRDPLSAQRAAGGISIRAKLIEADEVTLIGRQEVGGSRPQNEREQQVSFSTDRIQARKVRQIGHQLLSGISAEERRDLDNDLADLLDNVDHIIAES